MVAQVVLALQPKMAFGLSPELQAILADRWAVAYDIFETAATYLGDLQDDHRRKLYLISTTYSFFHELDGHSAEDLEPLFRERILTQTLEDYQAMLAEGTTTHPSCPQCRSENASA